MNKHRKERLLYNIKNYHGKNVPIDYKPEYQFSEQWQNKDGTYNFNSNNLFEELGSLYIAYSIFSMVLCVLSIWMISV